MAPKKNTEKPQTSEKKLIEKKAPKPKLKKEKVKLRIPTTIRIKIPNKNTLANKNDGTMDLQNVDSEKEAPAKLTKKQMTALTKKLELANEVAKLQLMPSKPIGIINEVNTPTVAEPTVTPNRKRRQPLKNVFSEIMDTTTASGLADSEEIVNEVNTPIVSKPTVKRIRKRRQPSKKASVELTDTTSGVTDSEVAKLQLMTTKPIETENEVNTPTVFKPTVKRIRKRRQQPKSASTEITDTTTASGHTDSEDAFDMTPKKKKRRGRPKLIPQKEPLPAIQEPTVPQPLPTVSQTTVPLPTISRPLPTVSKTTGPLPTVSQTTLPLPTVSQTTVPEPTVLQPKLPVKKKPVLFRNRKVIEKKAEVKKIFKQPNSTKLKITIANTSKKKSEESVNDTKASSPTIKLRTRRPTSKPKPGEGNLSSSDNTTESVSLLQKLEDIASQTAAFNNLETSSPSPNKCKASPVDSRKTSATNASELSWTKDISSSSTTSCAPVCSSDFFRIDKKMPVVSLTNIDHIRTPINIEKDLELSSESSSPPRSFTPNTPDREPSPDIDSRPSEANNYDSSTLDRLITNLKNFDLEIVNWIGYTDTDINLDVKKVLDNQISLLKEESEVIACCRRLQCVNVLSDIDEDFSNILNDRPAAKASVNNVNGTQKKNNVDNFAVPLRSETENVNDVQKSTSNRNSENQTPSKVAHDKSADNDNYFSYDKYKNMSSNYDDDDALSLFAESLTGMESNRMNSSAPSVENTPGRPLEEYIPQPMTQEWESPKITYVPTKISNVCKDKKIICEKQRADSTSITKDMEQEINNMTDTFFDNVQVASTSYAEENYSSPFVKQTVEKRKMPMLMANIWSKSLHGVKSQVFRGVCFYHLISRCKVQNCGYPHVLFQPADIVIRLVRLSEVDFIQEYMLLRNWPVLRRMYGMCFVEECKRRKLTRILVEMAIDFYMKTNEGFQADLRLQVIVAECVLLYLNSEDLQTCEDLLLYSVQPRVMLCDVFMKAIAETQNFSRFKPVFINLTKFIVDHGGHFDLDVATMILERVCILPCELPLSEALFDIVRHTDPRIFDVSMMGLFEKQMAGLDKELYAQFLVLKKDAIVNRPVLSGFEVAPRVIPEVEPLMMPPPLPEREARYTSPDTTNLDGMNKSTEESTRPIFTRPPPFNIKLSINNSPSKGEDTRPELRQVSIPPPNVSIPPPNFQTWKGQSVFDKIRRFSPQHNYIRPPIIKRRIHQQTSGPSPALSAEIERRNFPAGPVQTFFDM